VITVDFDDSESYSTDGPASPLKTGGYAHLKGYRIDEDGMVVMEFTNNALVKIPSRRLRRITES
jgi:flagellar hook protein FlgE